MTLFHCRVAPLVLVLAVPAAGAGEMPLYQPAPGWIRPALLPEPAKLPVEGPPFMLFDSQQRFEDGRVWAYLDTASRAATPEVLAQLATIAIAWVPDKGDLIIHRLEIIRGTERIDLIARGQRFTVLRREENLEKRELTGILTATLAVEGLQVGDTLRASYSTTLKDGALGGRIQAAAPVIAEPVRVGFARTRLSWPTATPVQWKIQANGVTAKPVKAGAFTEIEVPLPAVKQPELPDDAPIRFRSLQLVEASSFAGWNDVSRIMAPLYSTEGTIRDGGPIAAEVATIMAAEPTPVGRAQRALQLVQDKVRYLAIGMDGGNYVPQTPEKTWTVRYGDCKAKTLLLLAMLHAMNIDAEAVLAHAQLGDMIPQRLPSAAAFNHVLVRATINGESLWLDGTGAGVRLADIRDTPALRHVLPLRPGGAELVALSLRADARPTFDLSVDADESASVDLPSVFDAKFVLRGSLGAMASAAAAQAGEKQKRQMVISLFGRFLGEPQIADYAITTDAAAGTTTLTARGAMTTMWKLDDKRMKRSVGRAFSDFSFAPDRARTAWSTIPVAIEGPGSTRFSLRLRLPDGGKGYVIDGDQTLKARLAGRDITRSMTMSDGIVTIDERIDALGGEITPDQVAAERDRVATAAARDPRLVAPTTARRRWDIAGTDPAGATQVKALEAIFTKAIADDPEDVTSYDSRASFRRGIGDRVGALADLTRAIAIEPSVDRYLQRANDNDSLGNLAAALADAEAARTLDPSSASANGRVAGLRAERGDLAGAVSLLDERIALGGDTRTIYRRAKADLLGTFGDASEALKIMDAVVTEKPGTPSLLNARCWLKATRMVMIDTALKDCTTAIELSDNAVPALDSRALVWFRLGRYDDALRDLDVVLDQEPGLAASRFMRAIVLGKLGRGAEATRELALARRLRPRIDTEYARFGIKP